MSQTQSAWIAFAEETLEQAESARRLRSYLQCFLTKCGFGLRNSEQRRKILIAYGVLMIFACACKWEANEFPNCQGYESYNSLAEFFWEGAGPEERHAALQQFWVKSSSDAFALRLVGWFRSCSGRASVMLQSCLVPLTHGYGSIPFNTIFRGMNIHLPAILMFTRGTRFWHTATLRDLHTSLAWSTWKAGFCLTWGLVGRQ